MKDKEVPNLENHFFELSQDLMCVAGFDGYFKYINPSWEKTFGYTTGELLSKPFIEFIHPNDHKKSNQEISNLMKGKASINFENRCISKNGSISYIDWIATSNPDEKLIYCIGQDITKRKLEEKAYKESEAKLRSLFDNINVGAALHEIILDAKGKPVDFIFMDVNPTYEKITTLTKDKIIGKRGKDVIPNLEQKWIDLYGKVALTGKPVSIVDHSDFLDKYWEVRAYSPAKNQFAVALTDITDRIKAENMLKESQAKYKSLIQSSPMGMIFYRLEKDNSLKLIGANPSADKLLGISHVDLIGKTIEEAFPNLVQTEIPEMYRKVAKGELGHQSFEIPYQDKRFSGFYKVDVFSTQINTIAVHFMDISEMKNAEIGLIKAKEKAEESEAILKAAMENSQAGIAIADYPTGKLSYVNKAGLLIRNKNYDEIVKDIDINKYVESWQILHFDGTTYETDKVPLTRAVLYGETNSAEFIVRRDNNEDRYVWANAAPILNDKGKQIAAIVIFLDITESKLAEFAINKSNEELIKAKQKAQESERMARLFVENTPLPIAMFDTNMCYMLTSKRWAIDYKLTQKDLIGKSHYEVFPEIGDVWKEDHQRVLKGEIYKNNADKFVREDGTVQWLRYELRPWYQKSNTIGGLVMFTEDITEKVEAEQQLILAKEKAEEADRLKSAFLANMSHEIRTPLNGILGFTELLVDEEIEAEQKNEMGKIILENGELLLTIINDVLDISKIEAGQIVITKSKFEISKVINEVINLFKAKAQKKKLDLKINPNNVANYLTISSDFNRIKQVLANLVSNAIKYTDTGFVEVSCQKSKNEIIFCVTDSGIGIEEKKHKQIFERFNRQEAYTKNAGGNGLGLAISKSFVEMLGGKIWVESDPDGYRGAKGSKFYFTIPI